MRIQSWIQAGVTPNKTFTGLWQIENADFSFIDGRNIMFIYKLSPFNEARCSIRFVSQIQQSDQEHPPSRTMVSPEAASVSVLDSSRWGHRVSEESPVIHIATLPHPASNEWFRNASSNFEGFDAVVQEPECGYSWWSTLQFDLQSW